MNNIKSYEAIAREAGFVVRHSGLHNMYYWARKSGLWHKHSIMYENAGAAYRACCIENGLVEE